MNEEEIAGLLGHAVAVIDALANEPEDVVAGTEHPLALLLYEGVFAVGEVVADQLTAFHAKGDKGIACLRETQSEGSGDLIGIEQGCRET